MGVVAPLSAVGAALVPVLVGLVLGERPGGLEVLGMVAALPGIWLVSAAPGSDDGAGDSGGGSQHGSGVRDGLRAGAAFGLMFTALSRLNGDAGLWPIALSQAVSVLAVVSLYPAATILLAVGLLGERVHRPQAVGLALCGAAIALVAAG
jgi:drug/metabolite transporter (DMT)-like permease